MTRNRQSADSSPEWLFAPSRLGGSWIQRLVATPLLVMLLLTLGLVLAGCGDDSDDMGDRMSEAMEEVGDETEDAADEVEDEIDDRM